MPYEIVSQNADVLAGIAAHGAWSDHHPVQYRVSVGMSMTGRWASVECSCGTSERVWWLPQTETYYGLLADAWRALPCYKANSPAKPEPQVQVEFVSAYVEEPSVERGDGFLRVVAPKGCGINFMSEYMRRNMTTQERNLVRIHLGMPLVEEADDVRMEWVDLGKVTWSDDVVSRALGSL